jgi:hypothetical protein
MDLEILKKDLLNKYNKLGYEKFYNSLLIYAVTLITNNTEENKVYPEKEFLKMYDQFLILYRREGDIKLLEIARIFRRAAHTIYRYMLNKNIINKSTKFLNLV